MTVPTFLALVLLAPGVVVALGAGYLGLLALVARRRTAPVEDGQLCIDVIVPAHNEAQGLPATLRSLAALDYPAARVRVLVVADNCTDETAAIARAHGVIVLERHDTTRRGKGYALSHAFAQSAADGFAEVVMVVDADSTLAPRSLRAVAAAFRDGADAVQADYRVRNATDSWRTQLLEYAFTLHHTVRSCGRRALGWSCGLRGNGMAFRQSTLARVPYAAFSVVEDIEYGLQLGLAGIAVRYVAEAEVFGDMPESGDTAARVQRARWEVGRRTLRTRWSGVLWRAALRGQPLVLDLLADLLIPPLVTLGVGTLAGLGLAAALVVAGAPVWTLLPWSLAALSLTLYAVRGLLLARDPAASVRALAYIPVFVAWKLLGRVDQAAARDGEWVRTARRADS